jgi:hypothetical protein
MFAGTSSTATPSGQGSSACVVVPQIWIARSIPMTPCGFTRLWSAYTTSPYRLGQYLSLLPRSSRVNPSAFSGKALA